MLERGAQYIGGHWQPEWPGQDRGRQRGDRAGVGVDPTGNGDAAELRAAREAFAWSTTSLPERVGYLKKATEETNSIQLP